MSVVSSGLSADRTESKLPRGRLVPRPATCTINCAVRSGARKSGLNKPASALTTATRVTLGKWWPLASIWVPTNTQGSPRLICCSCSLSCRLLRVVSRSIRYTGVSANNCRHFLQRAECPTHWQKRRSATVFATLRNLKFQCAMVADHLRWRLMQRQLCVAIGTMALANRSFGTTQSARSRDD